jgi:hypothetical protein
LEVGQTKQECPAALRRLCLSDASFPKRAFSGEVESEREKMRALLSLLLTSKSHRSVYGCFESRLPENLLNIGSQSDTFLIGFAVNFLRG